LTKKTVAKARKRPVPVSRTSGVREASGLPDLAGCGPWIDAIGPCVLLTDREGRCVFANRACIEALGHRDSRGLVGQRAEGRIGAAIAAGRAAHVEEEPMLRADGSEVWVECWVKPVVQGGAVSGAVVSFVERRTDELGLEERVTSVKARIPDDRSQPLHGLTVLVIDNEEDARAIVAAILEQYGASVVAAESVAEAFRAIAEELPHVVVSDISMPEEDGYSFARRLRASPDRRVAGLPALALTALAHPEARKQALGAGFLVHMTKPVDPEELVRTVARLALSRER
jgi:CheY-like chemotaxis protein